MLEDPHMHPSEAGFTTSRGSLDAGKVPGKHASEGIMFFFG